MPPRMARRMMARRMMMHRAMAEGGCHGYYEEPSIDERIYEEYQRDLEQETADVAERIRKLKEARKGEGTYGRRVASGPELLPSNAEGVTDRPARTFVSSPEDAGWISFDLCDQICDVG
jgi:hypothetical protein